MAAFERHVRMADVDAEVWGFETHRYPVQIELEHGWGMTLLLNMNPEQADDLAAALSEAARHARDADFNAQQER